MTLNNFSRNKIITYEKIIKTILCDDDVNLNQTLITDMAFHMSEIANDKTLVHKLVEKKINYLIENTLLNTIAQINCIPNYEVRDDLDSRIGLKLSRGERDVIQSLLNEPINSKLFYEISLKNNNNNEEDDQTPRNVCVRFCSP